MKLRRRRRRLPSRAPPQPGRSQRPPPPRSCSPPFIISVLSPSTPSPPACAFYRPASPSPRAGRAILSSYPSSGCSASPFLIHKITEASERGGRGTQPAGSAVLSNDSMAGAQLAAPLPLHQIGWPQSLSGSNGSLSVTIGTIGKQRPKMDYPVSSPSLTNK